MSSYCKCKCELIQFVAIRQVRYSKGMKACRKCDKAFTTSDVYCHCCGSRFSSNRRDKN